MLLKISLDSFLRKLLQEEGGFLPSYRAKNQLALRELLPLLRVIRKIQEHLLLFYFYYLFCETFLV